MAMFTIFEKHSTPVVVTDEYDEEGHQLLTGGSLETRKLGNYHVYDFPREGVEPRPTMEMALLFNALYGDEIRGAHAERATGHIYAKFFVLNDKCELRKYIPESVLDWYKKNWTE